MRKHHLPFEIPELLTLKSPFTTQAVELLSFNGFYSLQYIHFTKPEPLPILRPPVLAIAGYWQNHSLQHVRGLSRPLLPC